MVPSQVFLMSGSWRCGLLRKVREEQVKLSGCPGSGTRERWKLWANYMIVSKHSGSSPRLKGPGPEKSWLPSPALKEVLMLKEPQLPQRENDTQRVLRKRL